MVNNDVLTPSADVLAPHNLKDVVRSMPDFQRMEMEYLHQEVSDLGKRENLAQRIAQQMMSNPEQYPDLPGEQELVQDILKNLDGLQEELKIEKEEMQRKADTFDAIDADPEKRGLLRKALDVVNGGLAFSWRHKWKILAVVALLATGAAAWYYWEQLAALLGEGWGGFGGAGGAEGAGEAVAGAAAVEQAAEQARTLYYLDIGESGIILRKKSGDIVEVLQHITDVKDPAQIDALGEMVRGLNEATPFHQQPNGIGVVIRKMRDVTVGNLGNVKKHLYDAVGGERGYFHEMGGYLDVPAVGTLPPLE